MHMYMYVEVSSNENEERREETEQANQQSLVEDHDSTDVTVESENFVNCAIVAIQL